MIDQLYKNIDTEIQMLREISSYSALLENAQPAERKILMTSLASLQASIKLINNSIPQILTEISAVQKLPAQKKQTFLESIHFKRETHTVDVALKVTDKEKFFKELRITEDSLKKIKKKSVQAPEEVEEFTGSHGYVKLANRFFLPYSEKFVARGQFKSLGLSVRRANFDILLESYVSMMFFSTVLSFFAGILLLLFLTFFDLTAALPFFVAGEGNYGLEFLKLIWLPFIIPPLTFWAIYSYPGSERTSIEKGIDQELPFAVIHMSAISGAGVEPTNIFKIIALSREYPHLRKEIRKLINQLNLYGYDLVTALSNVAKATPSAKLGELFTGLSTTINSGGSLSNYFEKRSETLLVSYRLEREKFTKIAETFMDIYITIAIAAPMILLLILVMLSLSNFNLGLGPNGMTLVVIAAVSIVNFLFLAILHVKQPAY